MEHVLLQGDLSVSVKGFLGGHHLRRALRRALAPLRLTATYYDVESCCDYIRRAQPPLCNHSLPPARPVNLEFGHYFNRNWLASGWPHLSHIMND